MLAWALMIAVGDERADLLRTHETKDDAARSPALHRELGPCVR